MSAPDLDDLINQAGRKDIASSAEDLANSKQAAVLIALVDNPNVAPVLFERLVSHERRTTVLTALSLRTDLSEKTYRNISTARSSLVACNLATNASAPGDVRRRCVAEVLAFASKMPHRDARYQDLRSYVDRVLVRCPTLLRDALSLENVPRRHRSPYVELLLEFYFDSDGSAAEGCSWPELPAPERTALVRMLADFVRRDHYRLHITASTVPLTMLSELGYTTTLGQSSLLTVAQRRDLATAAHDYLDACYESTPPDSNYRLAIQAISSQVEAPPTLTPDTITACSTYEQLQTCVTALETSSVDIHVLCAALIDHPLADAALYEHLIRRVQAMRPGMLITASTRRPSNTTLAIIVLKNLPPAYYPPSNEAIDRYSDPGPIYRALALYDPPRIAPLIASTPYLTPEFLLELPATYLLRYDLVEWMRNGSAKGLIRQPRTDVPKVLGAMTTDALTTSLGTNQDLWDMFRTLYDNNISLGELLDLVHAAVT